MSSPFVFNWPALDLASISALQTTAGAGNLILNGNATITLKSIYRKVSLTSAGNLSAINFTITGTGIIAATGLTGNITEVIAGPNANTVQSVNLFNTITSVSASAAVGTAVSVGTGSTGQSYYFVANYNNGIANTGVQVNVTGGAGNITYSLYASMFGTLLQPTIGPYFTPVVAMTAATTSQFTNLTFPMQAAYIGITASVPTGALSVVFLQQGIT